MPWPSPCSITLFQALRNHSSQLQSNRSSFILEMLLIHVNQFSNMRIVFLGTEGIRHLVGGRNRWWCCKSCATAISKKGARLLPCLSSWRYMLQGQVRDSGWMWSLVRFQWSHWKHQDHDTDGGEIQISPERDPKGRTWKAGKRQDFRDLIPSPMGTRSSAKPLSIYWRLRER